jgi:hypothetical protein
VAATGWVEADLWVFWSMAASISQLASSPSSPFPSDWS